LQGLTLQGRVVGFVGEMIQLEE